MGGRGSAPDPAGGAYSTPSDPLGRLRAPLLQEREGGEVGRGGEGKWYPHFLGESCEPGLA